MRSREACTQECNIHICTYAHAYTYRLQLKYGKKYIFYFLTDTFFALYWCLRVSIINYYKLLLFHNTSDITSLSCKHCTLPRYLTFMRIILLKCPAENAGNGISEILNSRIFWGEFPHPGPPYVEPPSALQLFFPVCVHLPNLMQCLWHHPLSCSIACHSPCSSLPTCIM